MAIHYWVGDGFIEMPQLESLSAQGALQELAKGKEKVEHRRGVISRKALADAAEPFTPIGLGKPLSIRMHTVYVGKLPGWGKKDLLVVSGVKAAETWEVSGRAVNLIQSRVGDHEFGEFSAFRQSCPIVY